MLGAAVSLAEPGEADVAAVADVAESVLDTLVSVVLVADPAALFDAVRVVMRRLEDELRRRPLRCRVDVS